MEALHAMENGLIKQCLQVLFTDSLNKSGHGHLDLLAHELYFWDQQHYLTAGTATDMPCLLFKDRITTITNVKASTNVGLYFLWLFYHLRTKGLIILIKSLVPKRQIKCAMYFNSCCAIGFWLKKEFYWKVGDTAAKEAACTAIQTMLSQLVAVWPRERGQG